MPFDAANYDAPVIAVSPNPVTALLETAWSLIDTPQKWCRGAMHSPDHRRRCSLGALLAAKHLMRVDPTDSERAYSLLTRATGWEITHFNDNSSHAEVAAVWQRAIARSREPR